MVAQKGHDLSLVTLRPTLQLRLPLKLLPVFHVGCLAYVVFRNYFSTLFTMAVFKLVFLFTVIDFRSIMAVLPQYTPAINADGLTRDEIIKEYFNLRMNYVEILSFLVNIHQIHIGLRQIKRT